ncbi:TetR/AcrR family transcriptional regulator [Nonomuraea glycinis]|uniref:TetR/AcrR family transcriptional regulator n=1 Tax=Nonomuraea glycinis TaxID=2047744 RepID=UPI0033AF976B
MPQKRRKRADERREDIMAAAERVFAERGYRAGSLAAIAEAVGISKQTLLHHFQTKEDLLVCVLERRDLRNLEIVADLGLTTEAMARLVDFNLDWRGLVHSYTVLSAESIAEDHPAHEFFTARYDRSRHELADNLRAEHGDRLPGGLTPEQAAPLIIAVNDGLQLQWLLSPRGVAISELFRAFLATLVPGEPSART